MNWALVRLVAAVDIRQTLETRQAAIDVSRATLDFLLRHRPVAEIDLALFDLWAAQVLVDAAAEDPAAVTGDVATLEWIWDRFGHTLEQSDVSRIDALLGNLRTAADDEDLSAASEAAMQLRELLATLTRTS